MSKIKALREHAAHMKIRTRLFLLVLVTGICCLTLFRTLWHNKWRAYYLLAENLPSNLRLFPMQDNNFWGKLSREAKKYDVPESEDDKEAVDALESFFAVADDYTGISVYGLEDGLYRAGYFPETILWEEPFNTFFQLTYRWVDEDVDQRFERAVEFKNGYATVMVTFYHSSFFIVPYAVVCLFVCVFLFLFVLLFFVGKKMKTIVRLEQAVLQMSSGDLITPVAGAGFDEIGILALELDKLRATLHENFGREQKVHQSNRELIAALSHDLRTPLTILKGYLEILQLGHNPDLQAEYIGRCMAKADDLKEMTDRMFEYALVFDEAADFANETRLKQMPIPFFLDSLREHADFLRLAGFQTQLSLLEPDGEDGCCMEALADETMVKRVFNNLFSNIIKYADKKEAVFISASAAEDFTIVVKNRIPDPDAKKPDGTLFGYGAAESTQIGLKSAGKMMERMNGVLQLRTEEEIFEVTLRFLNDAGRG